MMIEAFPDETLQRAYRFYRGDPDVQYDDVAEAAIEAELLRRKVEPDDSDVSSS